MGYSQWDLKETDTTEQLTLSLFKLRAWGQHRLPHFADRKTEA